MSEAIGEGESNSAVKAFVKSAKQGLGTELWPEGIDDGSRRAQYD